jgi:hypothetical protein
VATEFKFAQSAREGRSRNVLNAMGLGMKKCVADVMPHVKSHALAVMALGVFRWSVPLVNLRRSGGNPGENHSPRCLEKISTSSTKSIGRLELIWKSLLRDQRMSLTGFGIDTNKVWTGHKGNGAWIHLIFIVIRGISTYLRSN